MRTLERAEALAKAAAHFPELSPPTARDLMECVRLELGHEEILDSYQAYAGHQSMAIPAQTILHILSGNTPHAALQTMLRGLLLGSQNLVKFPSCGLGALEDFAGLLPPDLAAGIQCSRNIPEGWMERADAWVVFGSDATIGEFRARCPAGVRFQAHGHRVSAGVVLGDPDFKSCPLAARDVSLFEQQGCLSPHVIFVEGDPAGYAEALAREMEKFERTHPSPSLPAVQQAEVAHARADWEFRASADPAVKVWKGCGVPGWTVVLETRADMPLSPLNRFIFVKPMAGGFERWVEHFSHHLGGLGIWPCTPQNALRFSAAGFSRICAVGRMQDPPFTWHADSQQNLASLVRWVDFEP